nr:CoA transferase subunit A [Corynebacterium sp. CNCTC7651]
MTIAVGGFGTCGVPQDLLKIVGESGVKDLCIVSNNLAIDGVGQGLLLENEQISKVKASYIGENQLFMRRYLAGEIDLEFVPQGTLAERMRAGGAGIAAFFTRTGVGTILAEGKPTQEFDGETYVMEKAIKADIGLVRAFMGDEMGNLRYRLTARNFNHVAAMSGAKTFAEVENLVEYGEMDPDSIHTPGVYVNHVMVAQTPTVIEKVVNREA